MQLTALSTDPLLLTSAVELPDGLVEQALAAARLADPVERTGAGPGSLTDAGLRYEVVDGPGVERLAPLLWRWAHGALPALVRAWTGREAALTDHLASRVNVNVLRGRGARYELHVDSNPLTAVLFLTGPHLGGELRCETGHGLVAPAVGLVALLEGDRLPHEVLPLLEDGPRVSAPVSLRWAGVEHRRDPALDAHLYGRSAA